MAPNKLLIRFAQNRDYEPHRRGSQLDAERDVYVNQMRKTWRPPTDVFETDEVVVIKVEIPGMSETDFSVSLVDRCLIVTGNRQDPTGKLIYHNMEIRYGEFRTEVFVDLALDESAAEATYEDGFLFVRLPKKQKHRVQVKVRQENEPQGSQGLA